jgi:hypothetical protein
MRADWHPSEEEQVVDRIRLRREIIATLIVASIVFALSLWVVRVFERMQNMTEEVMVALITCVALMVPIHRIIRSEVIRATPAPNADPDDAWMAYSGNLPIHPGLSKDDGPSHNVLVTVSTGRMWERVGERIDSLSRPTDPLAGTTPLESEAGADDDASTSRAGGA